MVAPSIVRIEFSNIEHTIKLTDRKGISFPALKPGRPQIPVRGSFSATA